jgi:MFS family permease
MSEAKPTAAPESPLRLPVFRALWLATIVSNVGTWMHDVGAGWLMTSLSSDPMMVALVQAATTLPMFLFALPGGALADIVDRRRLLLGAQLWALLAAGLLALLVFSGHAGAYTLLALTFALATGAALSAPAFQAIVPELVGKAALPQAVALNSLGVNIARAIGPALGGLLIAASGPAAVFALNAVSVLGVALVLWRWKRAPTASHLPAEHFFGALKAGARYAREAPALQIVLIRSVGFFVFASALWALLPLIARRTLGLGPAEYGGLLTFMGAGAIAGAMALPKLRQHLSANHLTIAASVLFAVASFALAHATRFAEACAVMFVAGCAWIAMMSSLNAAAQLAAPAWVKARALAIYLLTFQGSMAAGAALWGSIAARYGIDWALMLAAAGLLLSLVLALRHALPAGAGPDLTPSAHWPAPLVEQAPQADRGPVLITVEYRIEPARAQEFALAMQALRRIRRRDGALSWGLYEDVEHPGLMLESFVVESWLEHLRQHERVTHADHEDQALLQRFHIGPEAPRVRHLLAP